MKYNLTFVGITAEQVTELVNGATTPAEVETVESPLKLITPEASVEAVKVEQNNSGEEIDVNGHEWDERVHASTKTKNKDGSWKRKRGVSDEEFANFIASKSTAPDVKSPPNPIATLAQAAAGIPPVPNTQNAPLPAPKAQRDFATFMRKLTELFSTGAITPDYPQTIVNRVSKDFSTNVYAISDIQNNADMVEYAWQCLEVDGKINA